MYTMFTVKKLSQNDVTTKNKQTTTSCRLLHGIRESVFTHSTLERLLAYIRLLQPVNMFDVTSQPVRRWT